MAGEVDEEEVVGGQGGEEEGPFEVAGEEAVEEEEGGWAGWVEGGVEEFGGV